VLLSVL